MEGWRDGGEKGGREGRRGEQGLVATLTELTEQTGLVEQSVCLSPRYRSAQGPFHRDYRILDLSHTPAEMCCPDFRARFIALAGF